MLQRKKNLTQQNSTLPSRLVDDRDSSLLDDRSVPVSPLPPGKTNLIIPNALSALHLLGT